MGQPNELVTKGWKITTKSHLSTIQPVTSDPRGIFQDGSCVCVSGRGSASSEFYAVVTFEDENGRLFKNLSLKLIHASSEPAWPTLYVRLKSGTQYCRVFSESQRNDLKDGKVIEIPHTDLHNKDAGGDCSTGQTDMRDGELISEVQLQVDNYEPNGRRDFNFCVPELTVNPGTPALAD